MNKIAVIGGGASGIMAAIAASKNGVAVVTIYESGARIGRKILATGNGRCNLTNINASREYYYGTDPDFINGAVNRFWVGETLDFFEGIGLLMKTEDEGRVYPYSNQASSVLDVLRLKLEENNVRIVTNFDVKSVTKTADGHFHIIPYKGKEETADKVIVATGGKAAPDLGSKGAGYEILRSFGHTITDLKPSLVQIKTETDIVKKLKGIRLDARVTVGNHSEYGEVLFTEYGLSGIAVFSLSSQMDGQSEISLDIMSGYAYDELLDMLSQRRASRLDITLEEFFTGMINKRVGQALLKSVGIAPLSRTAASLTDAELKKICAALKKWSFKITGTMSWNNAQVTRGGALTREFDAETMESKLVKGLYAAGEVLDIDGACGGYNLQWAWASGYIAGLSAAAN